MPTSVLVGDAPQANDCVELSAGGGARAHREQSAVRGEPDAPDPLSIPRIEDPDVLRLQVPDADERLARIELPAARRGQATFGAKGDGIDLVMKARELS